MQGVESRKPQKEKLPQTNSALLDGAGVQPEKYEARQRKEEVHGKPTLLIEQGQHRVERLLLSIEGPRHCANKEEVLPMPQHYG